MSPSALTVTGTTRLFGIVGDPIAQARSPSVFNAQFAVAGVDAVFLPFHVRPDGVEAALAGFTALANLDGLVITIPHKTAFAPLCLRLGPQAARVGAVNVIRRFEGGWEGELFDGFGFLEGLRTHGVDPRGRSWLVFGAGGAGSAIVSALLDEAPVRVAVTDPAAGRAERLCERLLAAVPGAPLAAVGPDVDAAPFDTVVNASPLGMQADDPLPFDPARIAPGALVCEVVMKPPVTRFLREAKARGHLVQPGGRMLDGQAELLYDYLGIPR